MSSRESKYRGTCDREKKKKKKGKFDTGDRKGKGGCDKVDLSHSALTLYTGVLV